MKTVIAITTLIFILLSLSGFSQIVNVHPVKYRVTAVKKGDYTITSQSNIVEAEPPLALYIPNAFTPDGDGLNDTFGVVGEGIQEYNMTIYNRWGEIIFESNDVKRQWDGTYHGEKVQQGAYLYNITVMKGNQNSRAFRTGTVTLVK